jgi:Xaa-Pro dipeptidase
MTRNEELKIKRARLREYLLKHGLDAVLLSSQANFAWYGCGADNHVVMCSEGGVAAILADGEKDCVITTNIEAGRIAEEEVGELKDFEVVGLPWNENRRMADEIKERTKGKKVASDVAAFGLEMLPEDFQQLTWQMTPAEISRYRSLGKECSRIIEHACMAAKRGETEHQLAARLASGAMARGIIPHLVLVAADERIRNYRHPVPTDRKIRRQAMAVLCGKKHGLICSLTRLFWFGKSLPQDLARRHAAVVEVDATFNAGTRPGRNVGEIFREAMNVYAVHGFADEWKLHHQGGACGYQGRSYKATPDSREIVLEHQAFAWNPSITGTKCEDTVLATEKGVEFLSAPTSKWPTVKVTVGGRTFRRPDILCLD